MSMSSLSSVGRRAAGAVRMPAAAWVQGGWMRREEAIMGTSISVELWSEDPSAGNAAMDLVIGEMHRIDRGMSPHKPDSELSRINREASVRPVPLSEEMFALLARSLEFSRRSEGAFDITFAGAGRLYDYRERIRPTDAALAQACAAVGHQYLELDAAARSVRFARDGLRIDLGGFAKGHAVDNAAAILARRGIRHAFISAGGDSRVIGDRRGRPWTIGVRDPRRPGEIVALLPLEDAAVSTSGDYERYFDTPDGARCHHILDPRTGKSPDSVRSVTIIAPDGLTSEALSKCLFVMGVERGLRFVESHAGVDAVVVDAAGALHYSSGLLAAGAQPRQ